jgi:hypothetical protein
LADDAASGTPDIEAPYENIADEKWALEALEFYKQGKLHVQAFDTEGVISAQAWGTCPRCGHELNVQATLSAPVVGSRAGRGLWAAITRREAPASAGVPESVDVGCGCERDHPGSPTEVTGCGVSFRLPTAGPGAPGASW